MMPHSDSPRQLCNVSISGRCGGRWWAAGGGRGHLIVNLGHPLPKVTAVIFPVRNLPALAQRCRRTFKLRAQQPQSVVRLTTPSNRWVTYRQAIISQRTLHFNAFSHVRD